MPTFCEFVPQFGTALHQTAERFAGKSGVAPQAQQAAYFEALYGLLVATEWSVGERLQRQGVPTPARDYFARFVRNQLLGDVIPRRMVGFSPSSPDVANAVAGQQQVVDQREQEYRQQLQSNPSLAFSQLNAVRILTAVGLNPNDPNSAGAAARDVDEAIGSLRLPEATPFLAPA